MNYIYKITVDGEQKWRLKSSQNPSKFTEHETKEIALGIVGDLEYEILD